MSRRRASISLLSLLGFAGAFALGWWVRGWSYERDVYVAAEKIAVDAGGIFVPELGVLQGGRRFAKKYNAMSPAAKAALERRLEYYREVEPELAIEKPTFLEMLGSWFTPREQLSESSDAEGTPQDAAVNDPVEVEARIERFRARSDQRNFGGFGGGNESPHQSAQGDDSR